MTIQSKRKQKREYTNGMCLLCSKEDCKTHSFEIQTLLDYVNSWASVDSNSFKNEEERTAYCKGVMDIFEKIKEIYLIA